MKLRKLILASVVGLAATGASADTYLSVFGGYTKPSSTDFQTSSGTVTTDSDDGWGLGIAFGKRLRQVGAKNRLRIEGELSYRKNDVKNLKLNGTSMAGPTGSLKSSALMANVYIDFNEQATFTPYLGAGLGLVNVDAQSIGATGTPNVLNDGDSVFAYQLIAGGGWDVSEKTEIFVEYRYFGTDDVGVKTTPAAGSVSTKFPYRTNNIFLGARFNF